MKVGILGGSFNPPHAGHLHVSKLALKELELDQVWWIPAVQNPLKSDQTASYQNRIELCDKILESESQFKIHQSDEIYSYKLVENLKRQYPQIDFIWVMGADNLENLHLWKNYQDFISAIKLAIFSRKDSLNRIKETAVWGFLKNKAPKIFFTPNLDISSTEIRQKINE